MNEQSNIAINMEFYIIKKGKEENFIQLIIQFHLYFYLTKSRTYENIMFIVYIISFQVDSLQK